MEAIPPHASQPLDDSGLPPPPDGVRVWRNKGNGLPVVRVHWTADPAKCKGAGREEILRIKAQIGDRAFAREYDINFEAPGGEPVVPEFDATRMVRQLRVLPGARPLRGWDFGHVCPAGVLAQLDPWGRFQILREVLLEGASLEGLIAAMQAATTNVWPAPREPFDAGDPSGEMMTDLGQVKQVMAEHGVILHTARRIRAHRDTEGATAAFRTLLQQEVVVPGEGRTPKFLVDPQGCPMLVRALSGAYHKSPRHPHAPVPVHPFVDVFDATRYLWDNLRGENLEGFDARMRQAAVQDEVALLAAFR
jgi:hypothetical protein